MKHPIACAVLMSAISAMADGVKQEIRFKRGESGATVSGGLIRGDRDQYTIGAGKGQYLNLDLKSNENNAVLEVWAPGYKVAPDGEVTGAMLTSSGGVSRFTSELPSAGRYLVVVGGTRGNAQYELSVGITAERPRPSSLSLPTTSIKQPLPNQPPATASVQAQAVQPPVAERTGDRPTQSAASLPTTSVQASTFAIGKWECTIPTKRNQPYGTLTFQKGGKFTHQPALPDLLGKRETSEGTYVATEQAIQTRDSTVSINWTIGARTKSELVMANQYGLVIACDKRSGFFD